jgi:Zn-dependent protease with chaperone function
VSEFAPDLDHDVIAELFDGVSARRHTVHLHWDAATLSLAGAEDVADQIDWAQVILIDILPECFLLGRPDRPGWRLKLGRDAPADLVAHLPSPRRFGRWIDRLGLAPSVLACAAVSAALVLTVVTAPGWLGPRVPWAWEGAIGEDVVGDLSADSCSTPASDAALATLAGELDRGGRAPDVPPVRIQLIRFGAINAVAVPGARILVFDGLVQAIGSPDALAGVVGHELGHVRKRHVMQAMLRQFGLSLLLGAWKSGMGNMLGQFTAMHYSRDAESEADAWSRARLADDDISPLPTADFFALLARNEPYQQPGLAAYFASHPDTTAREQVFRAAFRPDRVYRPALTDAQFSAIVSACAQDIRAKPPSAAGSTSTTR